MFILILIYRKKTHADSRIFQMLQYLLAKDSMNIKAGKFNYNLSKVSEKKLIDIFTDRVQMINKLTHKSGS